MKKLLAVLLSWALVAGVVWIVKPSAPLVTFVKPEANQYERAQSATVLIETEKGFGSGFVQDHRGVTIIWTANHVVEGFRSVTVSRVIRHSGVKVGVISFYGIVVAQFPEIDVALVGVPAPDGAFGFLEWEITSLSTGSPVFCIGNFFGKQFDGSVSRGTISQIGVFPEGGSWPWGNLDQTDARINAGSSGGPVLSEKTGRVIGIAVGGPAQGALGISCYVPMREISRAVRKRGLSFP